MSTIKKIIIGGLILCTSALGVFTFPKTLDLYKNVGGGSGTITKLPGSGLALGTQFDVPFMNTAGTAYTTWDGNFEYNASREHLDLLSQTNPDDGVLHMDILANNTVFKSTFGDVTTQHVLAPFPLSTGVKADVGSWGSENNYFWIKYGTDLTQWGKALYVDNTNTIRSPDYPVTGSMAMNFDTGTGGFSLGDIFGVGDQIQLLVSGGQLVLGNISNTNVFIDDTVGQIIYAFGAVNKSFFNSYGLQIQPGTSSPGSNLATVGGKLHSDTTTVGNVGTGEDNLMTYTIAANSLDLNQQSITGRASGTIANSINAKRLRFKFGSTTCMDTGAAGFPISTAISWTLQFEIIRTGATTQKCNANLSTNNASLASYVGYATPAETLSGAVTLKLTGEATSNNDVVEETLTVNWEPQA